MPFFVCYVLSSELPFLKFLKDNFEEVTFENNYAMRKVSNSLEPDQARPFVGPDLGPNRLQTTLAGIELTQCYIAKIGIIIV